MLCCVDKNVITTRFMSLSKCTIWLVKLWTNHAMISCLVIAVSTLVYSLQNNSKSKSKIASFDRKAFKFTICKFRINCWDMKKKSLFKRENLALDTFAGLWHSWNNGAVMFLWDYVVPYQKFKKEILGNNLVTCGVSWAWHFIWRVKRKLKTNI